MYAVVIEVDTSGQPDPEAGLKLLREQIVPGVSQAPGFQAGYWLRPLDDGGLYCVQPGRERSDELPEGVRIGQVAGVWRRRGDESREKDLTPWPCRSDELGPKGINVVALHPGATRTRMYASMQVASDDAGGAYFFTRFQNTVWGVSMMPLRRSFR